MERDDDINAGRLVEHVTAMVGHYDDEKARYREAQLAAWGPEGTETWKQICATAQAMVKGVESLAAVEGLRAAQEGFFQVMLATDDQINSQELMQMLDEQISISFGYEICGMMDDLSKRFWNVLRHARPVAPGSRAASFLQRVSRCYLFGFDNECIIMCRGVLDVEFESEISADDCITILGNAAGPRSGRIPSFGFADRIAVALQLERITPQSADKAHVVRKLGNRAVHVGHVEDADSVSMIRNTLDVLKDLKGSDDG